MSEQIGFHHGALCDKYEKQANEQGYTLGDKAEVLEKEVAMRFQNLEHPDITRCLETGYPYPVSEELDEDEIWAEFPEED